MSDVVEVTRKRKPHQIIIAAILLLIIICSGVAFFFYSQQSQDKSQVASSSDIDSGEILSMVRKHIELPDETPTIADVSDVTKLKGQQFFKNAKNGDKVLLFIKSQQVILYRPSIDKIIQVGSTGNSSEGNEVGSLLEQDSGQSEISPTPKEVRIIISNGTTIVGLAKKWQEELSKTQPNVEVVKLLNASKDSYTESLIVPLSEDTSFAANLATSFKGKISKLPEGEVVSQDDAEFLVILGSSSEE